MDNFKDFIDILGDLGDLVKIFANNLYTTRPIKFAHFSFFLITLQVIENFAKCFGMVKGFSRLYISSFFEHFLFAKIFLQILKVEHTNYPMMCKFVPFGH